MSRTRFVIACALSLAGFMWIIASKVPDFANEVAAGDTSQIKDSLGLLKDATVWMAGLQTATIAALGFLAKDGLSEQRPSEKLVRLAMAVAMINTVALFLSAWILTALPSIHLRLLAKAKTQPDFFNYTLYAFMEKEQSSWKWVTVNLVTTLNHWLWAIGVILFGILGMAVFAARRDAHDVSVPPAPRVHGTGCDARQESAADQVATSDYPIAATPPAARTTLP